MKTSGWVTCAKPSRRNTDPGVPHTFSRRFLKQNYPKYISDVVSKILEEKKQLSNVLSEFVIFLKLGFLWWKLKIFIANFSHVSPNRFWRIFSMLLNSHSTIKWRWKKFLCNYFDTKPQFDWTTTLARRLNQSCFPAVLQSNQITIKFGTAEARRLNNKARLKLRL